ncbi:hypothetical protein B0H63DRAFT_31638 [Podospora didyma]|uniref:Uncharacterized protein n=1 Tax=Podospora didyma TaxID=330526 RepID=A0AAE0U849_9PEZI|nr:hypothetical protein B0H63DRAFT_31638 [Podospora didyma]
MPYISIGTPTETAHEWQRQLQREPRSTKSLSEHSEKEKADRKKARKDRYQKEVTAAKQPSNDTKGQPAAKPTGTSNESQAKQVTAQGRSGQASGNGSAFRNTSKPQSSQQTSDHDPPMQSNSHNSVANPPEQTGSQNDSETKTPGAYHRHTACIPPIRHRDADDFHHPQCAHKDGFCLHATPKKVDDVFLLKMRDEHMRLYPSTSQNPSHSKSPSQGSSRWWSKPIGFLTGNLRDDQKSGRGDKDLEKGSANEEIPEKKTLDLVLLQSHRRLEPRHLLARYLIDAARLYEAMASFRDQMVIEKYLFPGSLDNPDPENDCLHLHPRRTLDQSHFWKLRTTRRRDRDPVVYRHTAARFAHKLIDDTKRLTLLERLLPDSKADMVVPKAQPTSHAGPTNNNQSSPNDQPTTSTNTQPAPNIQSTPNVQPVHKIQSASINDTQKEDNTNDVQYEKCLDRKKYKESRDKWRWTGHTKREDEYECEQCKQDICKVARAVMVDQLWMWLLGEDTILTCFPKRYGATRKDPSGVHYGIRKRFADQTNSPNQA